MRWGGGRRAARMRRAGSGARPPDSRAPSTPYHIGRAGLCSLDTQPVGVLHPCHRIRPAPGSRTSLQATDYQKFIIRLPLFGKRLAGKKSVSLSGQKRTRRDGLSTNAGCPDRVLGRGLHTGESVQVKVTPAPPGTGLVFRRVDLDDFEIEAVVQNVARVAYATTLMEAGSSDFNRGAPALIAVHLRCRQCPD